ncbi:MAG: zinc ribbon domain-containing protein, partial [Clostridia bacterium]|nr:zinc ribbon domain-containing protein [Clostridia bacterium]
MFCQKCGKPANPSSAFCTACGASLPPHIQQPAATPPQINTPSIHHQESAKKKNPLPLILGIALAIALIVTGILLVPPLIDDGGDDDEASSDQSTGKSSLKTGGFTADGALEITLGNPKELDSSTIGEDGGAAVVSDKGSKLDGLSIKVPAGAYESDTTFTISEIPLKTDFGDSFKPLTPLIRVENGGMLANGFMELFVPCKVPEGSEPTAWYVDESTGEIEAIPVLDVTDEGVTLSVRHFSDILVGAEKIADLKNLGVVGTDFSPGVDDWKFTNRGSAYAPGGHCAGQTLSAMWYYMFRKSGGSLYGKFDNYGWKDYGFETPSIWQDDVMGYRLATTVQETLDWSDQEYKDFMNSSKRSPRGTYYAFVNIMNRTKRPQFVGILRKKPDGSYGGHALIAYKIDTENSRIYVADPNYPGDTERYIEYDDSTGSFKPYSAAPNRDAADAGDYYSYTEILFIGISSFMDLDKLNGCFKDFDNRTVGNSLWQSRDLKMYTKVTDADGNEQEVEITDGYTAPAQLKITRFQTAFSNSKIELFLHNAKGDQSLGDFGSEMLLNLEPGDNYIGIYHKTSTPDGKLKYFDFMWVKVTRQFDFTGEWTGEMTWTRIDMPALTDVIAAIPHGENEDSYQREVQSVTEEYNQIVYDMGKTYPSRMSMSFADGTYEADIVQVHDTRGCLLYT